MIKRYFLICVGALTIFFLIGFQYFYLKPFPGGKMFEVAPHERSRIVAHKLSDGQFLREVIALLGMYCFGAYKNLKPGEYSFPEGLSLKEMITAVSHGQYRVPYKITVVEGETVRQVLQKLRSHEKLKGLVHKIPEEGLIYPDTYVFFKGDDRQKLLQFMIDKMRNKVEEHWRLRDPSLSLKSSSDLLVLASIIEKETHIESERALIAGVFYNRLKLRMPLQSDPTVIYALSQNTQIPLKTLTKKDLKYPSLYNTYLYRGLPPSAIAVPGMRSLYAAAHPFQTQALYFVADSEDGKGHVFSTTLKDHAYHHRQLRKKNGLVASKKKL